MRRLIICIVLLSTLFTSLPVQADSASPEPGTTVSDDLCPVDNQSTKPGACSLYGPGGQAFRNRLNELSDNPTPLAYTVPTPNEPIITHTYAKVVNPDTQVFNSPADGVAGNVARTIGHGYIYVSYGNFVNVGDQQFIRINNGEYVKAGQLATATPSSFQGIALTQQPERPFAWVVRPFDPRLLPGGLKNPTAKSLERYDIVQIYGKVHYGEYDWYLIGHNQWVEQRNLGVVEVTAPPEGVTGKWISVNLFEQTMAVYEGTRMVYASLVSSGLGAWPTRPGLHQIFKKMDITDMTGAFAADKSDYYYIEDVPWVMYFDDGISFHGTYWHNKFGFQQSHGCVNLSPKDSRWLYDWASVGTYVYVYDPSGRTPTTPWTGGGP